MSGSQVNYPLGSYHSATEVEKAMAQGSICEKDVVSTTDATARLLGGTVSTFRLVKNDSGGAISAKYCQKWKSGSLLTATGGVSGTADTVAGIVDQTLGSATVPDGSYYWLCVHGPQIAIGSAAVSANARLAPAASGKTAASSSPPNAYDFGYAIEAATGDTDEHLVHVGLDFA